MRTWFSLWWAASVKMPNIVFALSGALIAVGLASSVYASIPVSADQLQVFVHKKQTSAVSPSLQSVPLPQDVIKVKTVVPRIVAPLPTRPAPRNDARVHIQENTASVDDNGVVTVAFSVDGLTDGRILPSLQMVSGPNTDGVVASVMFNAERAGILKLYVTQAALPGDYEFEVSIPSDGSVSDVFTLHVEPVE